MSTSSTISRWQLLIPSYLFTSRIYLSLPRTLLLPGTIFKNTGPETCLYSHSQRLGIASLKQCPSDLVDEDHGGLVNSGKTYSEVSEIFIHHGKMESLFLPAPPVRSDMPIIMHNDSKILRSSPFLPKLQSFFLPEKFQMVSKMEAWNRHYRTPAQSYTPLQGKGT